MSRISTIPHFEMRIDFEDPNEDIFGFLNCYRPSWKRNEIEYEKLSGGVINMLYHCYKRHQRTQGIVIRIFSDRLDKSIFGEKKSRDKDLHYVKALSDTGCFPKLLASFQNGYCYEFYDGLPLSNNLNNLGQEKYVSAVAKALVKMHKTKVGSKSNQSTFLTMLSDCVRNMSEENFHTMKKSIPEFPCKTELLTDLKLIESSLRECQSPLVLCHGDFHTSNLLWNAMDDHVKLVDCDVIWYNYQSYDIGYHFISFHFDTVVGDQTLPITEEEYQRRFVKHYLCHWFEDQGRDPEEVTTSDIERLLVQSKKGMLAASLYLFSFFVSVINKGQTLGPMDIVDFTRKRVRFYRAKREEYFSLQPFH